jgi:hypothetical protein
MKIEKEIIDKAFFLFKNNGKEFTYSGKFVEFYSNVHFIAVSEKKYVQIKQFLNYVIEDISSLETLIFRLNWQKELVSDGKLDDILWMEYAKCDIELFFITIRSIFDYLGEIIKELSIKPGQIPNSFEKLMSWSVKSEFNRNNIGLDFVNLLSSCSFFLLVRDLRNATVHRGGFTIVFPQKEQIGFQVFEEWKNKVYHTEIMINENVADFELYAAFIISYLFSFLEDFSVVADKKMELKKISNNPRSSHFGLPILLNWISKLQTKI